MSENESYFEEEYLDEFTDFTPEEKTYVMLLITLKLSSLVLSLLTFAISAANNIMRMIFTRGIGLFFNRANHIKDRIFSPKNLLYTNVVISMSLSSVGDILEQHYEMLQGEWHQWSPTRTRHMAISGMSIGVFCHHWYQFLDRKMPGKTINIVLKKVLVDQIVCSPLCIGMFFLTLAILEETSWSKFQTEIKAKAQKLYVAEWVVWPPAQIINFYCLPTRFRVLYDNTISLGYDVYTSQVKYN